MGIFTFIPSVSACGVSVSSGSAILLLFTASSFLSSLGPPQCYAFTPQTPSFVVPRSHAALPNPSHFFSATETRGARVPLTRLYYASTDDNVDVKMDPLHILGIFDGAVDKKMIKRAYKSMARKFHPDIATSTTNTAQEKKAASDRFAVINWAYATLMENEKIPSSLPSPYGPSSTGGTRGAHTTGGQQQRETCFHYGINNNDVFDWQAAHGQSRGNRDATHAKKKHTKKKYTATVDNSHIYGDSQQQWTKQQYGKARDTTHSATSFHTVVDNNDVYDSQAAYERGQRQQHGASANAKYTGAADNRDVFNWRNDCGHASTSRRGTAYEKKYAADGASTEDVCAQQGGRSTGDSSPSNPVSDPPPPSSPSGTSCSTSSFSSHDNDSWMSERFQPFSYGRGRRKSSSPSSSSSSSHENDTWMSERFGPSSYGRGRRQRRQRKATATSSAPGDGVFSSPSRRYQRSSCDVDDTWATDVGSDSDGLRGRECQPQSGRASSTAKPSSKRPYSPKYPYPPTWVSQGPTQAYKPGAWINHQEMGTSKPSSAYLYEPAWVKEEPEREFCGTWD